MRVLILSANTGGGYSSTAQAIAEQMEKIGMEYEITDALALISESTLGLVGIGNSASDKRFSGFFRRIFQIEEKHTPQFLYEQCAKGADALAEKLAGGQYDAIVCVHIFAAMMLTEARVRTPNSIPSYFVATDYTATPGVSEIQMDAYFVPHRLLHADFIRCLIPADRMFATGIPVRRAFFEELDRAEARAALHLPREGKMVLIGSGSMGRGRLEKNALLFKEQLPDDAFLVVLCGHNQKVYDALQAHADEQMIVLGYTDRVAEFMSAADLYVTKSGGLSASEAIAKQLPMLLIDAESGYENRNYRFLIRAGVAEGAKTWKAGAQKVAQLLSDSKAMEAQKQAMQSFGLQNAAEAVCRQLLKGYRTE